MGFLVSYCTDKGIIKEINEDGLMLKSIRTNKGSIGLFVVCDGVGGLGKGELASTAAITIIGQWFDNILPGLVSEDEDTIVDSLNDYIYITNKEIVSYSKANSLKIGTTLTAMLCIYNKYYLYQVGDSRAYEINNRLNVLTKDQTYVAREIERGNITEEQAKTHPKRSMLLQCIGARENIKVVITEGEINYNSMYLICSDGFHHKLEESEFINIFNPKKHNTEETLSQAVKNTVNLVMDRKERDNITALIIKPMV